MELRSIVTAPLGCELIQRTAGKKMRVCAVPSQRWFCLQYRLVTLLTVLVALGCGLGLVKRQLDRAKPPLVVQRLREAGCVTTYWSNQGLNVGCRDERITRLWLGNYQRWANDEHSREVRTILGQHAERMHDVRQVEVVGAFNNAQTLQAICKLPQLSTLIYQSHAHQVCPPDHDWLTELRAARHLQVLVLFYAGDVGFAADLPKLETLLLLSTDVTDFTSLSSCSQLQWLGIELTNLKNIDSLLEGLEGLDQLKQLDLLGKPLGPGICRDLEEALPDCEIRYGDQAQRSIEEFFRDRACSQVICSPIELSFGARNPECFHQRF